MKRKIIVTICSGVLAALLMFSMTACTMDFKAPDPNTGEEKNYHISIGKDSNDGAVETPGSDEVIDQIITIDEKGDDIYISIGKYMASIEDLEAFLSGDFQEYILDKIAENYSEEDMEEILISAFGDNYEEVLNEIISQIGGSSGGSQNPTVIEEETTTEVIEKITEEVIEETTEEIIEETTEEAVEETTAVTEKVFDEDFASDVHVLEAGWLGFSADKTQIKIEMDKDPDENFGWSVAFSNDALIRMVDTGDSTEGASTEFFGKDNGTDYGVFKGRRAADGSFKEGEVTLIFKDYNSKTEEIKYQAEIVVQVNKDGTIEFVEAK